MLCLCPLRLMGSSPRERGFADAANDKVTIAGFIPA